MSRPTSRARSFPASRRAGAVSEDGLVWTFKLRGNAAFHDGTLVTAEATVASLQRALAGVGVLSQAPIAKISIEGKDIQVRMTKPFSALPAYLVHFSTIVLAPSSFDAAGKITQIVGTGPYKVKSLTPPARVELEASGAWWGGKPGIEEVNYLAVGQGETRALMAESGEADLVFSMLPVSVDRLKANPKLDVQIATIPRTRLLKVNAASPFFDQVEERQAISAAIDRVGTTKVILRNADLAATQLFPPAMKGWNSPDVQPLERDIEKAKELLKTAGWVPGSDGILEKDGKRFSVSLLTYASWPELPPIATALQAQLRQVGIDVSLRRKQLGNPRAPPGRDVGDRTGFAALFDSARPGRHIAPGLRTGRKRLGLDGLGQSGDPGHRRTACGDKRCHRPGTTPGPRRGNPAGGTAEHSGHVVGTGHRVQQTHRRGRGRSARGELRPLLHPLGGMTDM
ncbi:ABC transporter substrate-binding protein, partial [Sinorhizobium meliloti]|uniref:ABC transporter substrate-binding protein n=1 Tax=Rhizobium meliloti TaxID=382 RepID=UPI003F5CE6BC